MLEGVALRPRLSWCLIWNITKQSIGLIRLIPMLKCRPLKKIQTGLSIVQDTLLGEMQRLLGWPIWRTGTPRLALEEWLQEVADPPPVRGRYLITALRNPFWIFTNLYIACVLRGMGYASTVVFRGSQTQRYFRNSRSRFRFWPAVRRIPDIELVDLEAFPALPSRIEAFLPLARAWAPLTVAYDEHLEEADINEDLERYAGKVQMRMELSARLAASLEGLLDQRKFDRFICQSGLVEETPLLLEAARRHSLGTVCLESWAWRPGHLILNRNAPALEYDPQLWMKAFEPWDTSKEEEIRHYLDLVDGGCQGGSDWLDNFQRIQPAGLEAGLPASLREFLRGSEPVFLAPTNVIGDSSMLRRETIFPGQRAWIRKLLAFFAKRPGLKLVIRAHPAELWAGGKVRVRMGDFSRTHAKGQSNVRVVGPEDPVNTFALLPGARAGLVWVSSAGAEMVARGTPVMTAARPKYEGLGMVSEPACQADYWAELERMAASPARPSAFQRESALRYLYVVFKGISYEVTGRRAGSGMTTNWVMKKQRQLADHRRFFALITGESPWPGP